MSTLDIINQDGTLVVSSETIADGSGVQHKNVLDLIDSRRLDFEDFGRVAFETRTFQTAGGRQSRRFALLNEAQATLLMTFQRNTDQVVAFKKALVKAFFDMARQLVPEHEPQWSLPQNFAEALRELASTVEERDALEAKVELDAPKVGYVDTYVASEDLRLVRNVAKSIGVTESALRDALIDHGWVYAEHTDRWSESKQAKETITRYSAFAAKKDYFRPVPAHDAPRFKGEVMHTLKVTPKGAAAIARIAPSWGLLPAEAVAA